MIIPCRIFLRMRNVSDESCRQNQKKYFVFKFPPPETREVYVIMKNDMVQPNGTQMTV